MVYNLGMPKNIIELVKEKRKKLGKSLRDLAKVAGCSPMLLSLWEQGKLKKKGIGKSYFKKITKDLEIPKSVIASYTKTSPTVKLEEAFRINAKDEDKLVEFVDLVNTKQIDTKAWEKILEIAKKMK